jgi:hypothetical protein
MVYVFHPVTFSSKLKILTLATQLTPWFFVSHSVSSLSFALGD